MQQISMYAGMLNVRPQKIEPRKALQAGCLSTKIVTQQKLTFLLYGTSTSRVYMHSSCYIHTLKLVHNYHTDSGHTQERSVTGKKGYQEPSPNHQSYFYHFDSVLVVSQEWSWWRSFDSIPLQELEWSTCIPETTMESNSSAS